MPVSRGRKKARKRRRQMTSMEEQVCLMVIMHFPELVRAENLDAMSCNECADFLQEDCSGRGLKGRECIGCMEDKAKSGEFGVIGISP